MVGPGVRVHQLTVNTADDPAHISEQLRPEVGCEQWLAVLGRKDDVGEDVGKGVSHRLSPLWGSPILTQLLVFWSHGSERVKKLLESKKDLTQGRKVAKVAK